ncbi:hypothetical protein Hanom_Chr10g00914581 [Helianthus anomalus]
MYKNNLQEYTYQTYWNLIFGLSLQSTGRKFFHSLEAAFKPAKILVLKSERRTKATRSEIEARSAKRKSGGLFVPEAQDVYIIFLYIPYISHRFLASFKQNIAINKALYHFTYMYKSKNPRYNIFMR